VSTTPLYLRWLWWKHTWTFQAAHKPLCARFHRDVLRLGPLHVCRSCTALYGSFALALILAPLYAAHWGAGAATAVSALLLAVVVASAPPVYRHASRLQRDFLRASLGTTGGISIALLFTPAWPWGAVNLAGLGLAWLAYRRLRDRRAEVHDACTGCDECGKKGVCSGFAQQATHLRAYEEAATDWLEQGVGHSRPTKRARRT
jgi:hypothetical protein